MHGVDCRRRDFEGHDIEREPLHFLDARDHEGPTTDHDQGLGVEAAGHDDGLVGASGHEAHSTHFSTCTAALTQNTLLRSP